MQLVEFGHIGSGQNSGFQALNLAAQFGATDIALIGYDMRLDRGIHWHGKHPNGLSNPKESTMAGWIKNLEQSAPILANAGVKVTNCSLESALTCWPKMELSEWLSA